MFFEAVIGLGMSEVISRANYETNYEAIYEALFKPIVSGTRKTSRVASLSRKKGTCGRSMAILPDIPLDILQVACILSAP